MENALGILIVVFAIISICLILAPIDKDKDTLDPPKPLTKKQRAEALRKWKEGKR